MFALFAARVDEFASCASILVSFKRERPLDGTNYCLYVSDPNADKAFAENNEDYSVC